ncbi:MAG TPA: zinc ribbon domain-containing protein [Pyrinomonadaceae bacterium]|nr:zinc ribbon domain-containing protein [Pyrinomonadaceae bacterium]
MFCPQCGQQQVSGEIRFCSRCGLPLNVVAEVLAAGGALPSSALAMLSGDRLSPRQRGVRRGAMWMLSTMLLVPLIAIITGGEEAIVAIVALSCFVGGLLRIIYALMFEEKFLPAVPAAAPPYVPPGMPAQMNAAPPQNAALPPRQSTPAPSFMPLRRGNTAELVHPPSVTDHTTRLLNKDRPDAESEAR